MDTSSFNPSQQAGLFPGANMGGGGVGFSTPAPNSGLGGANNPFGATVPTGMSSAPSNTLAPGNVTGTAAGSTPNIGTGAPSSPFYSPTGATAGLAGLGGQVPGSGAGASNIAGGLVQAGFPQSLANSLAGFIGSGAGFNPQVAQALISALQPQFAAGAANLAEQFGSRGLGASSANALAQSSYYANENLQVGQLLSGLYEQSVQNYLQVLLPTSNEATNKQNADSNSLNSLMGAASRGLGMAGKIFGF